LKLVSSNKKRVNRQRKPQRAPEPEQQVSGQTKPRRGAGKKVALTIGIVIFLCVAGFGAWYYYWTTHATFDYVLKPIVILEGQSIYADDFLDSSGTNEGIWAAFQNTRMSLGGGRHDIPLKLTLGWRSLETTAQLYILTPISREVIEFAEERPVFQPAEFISNVGIAAGVYYDLIFTEEPLSPDKYPVGDNALLRLSLNGAAFTVPLIVEDTTAPAAIVDIVEIKIGESASPEDFVLYWSDASHDESDPPAITFVNEPNFLSRSESEQIVEIKIEDRYGNWDTFNAGLRIQLNREDPTIEGIETLYTMVGNPIVFLDGVSAFDDFGRDIEEDLEKEIEIINNTVNIYEAGEYSVTYRVEDLSGRYTEIEVTVHVLSIDPEYVETEADKVLDDILRPGMTQVQQAQAINNWVRINIRSSGTRGGSRVVYEAAYRALRDRRGNCYNYYALSEVLLTRAGIPNMLIERVPGHPTHHRWNLINPDDLGWHHFDAASPRSVPTAQLYMFTASQAAQFSRLNAGDGSRGIWYDYNPSLYPAIVQ